MNRILATIALAAAPLMLTGLLSIAPTAASTSPPKLSAMLLSIGQMPTGWAVVDKSSGSGSGSSSGAALGCLNGSILEPQGVKQTAFANIDFELLEDLPAVGEQLSTYTNAQAAYTKIVAKLAACKRLNGKMNGDPAKGTFGQMSFPHYGNASEAFAARFTVGGVTLGEVLVIVRKGSIVMGIYESDFAPVDVSQFQGFVVKAVKKVG